MLEESGFIERGQGMRLMIVARVGFLDFCSLGLWLVYLLCGVGTGMLAWQAYCDLSLSILAGFFWPLAIAWMLADHVLCVSLVRETFGFLLQ
jgi:hypothetical protein